MKKYTHYARQEEDILCPKQSCSCDTFVFHIKSPCPLEETSSSETNTHVNIAGQYQKTLKISQSIMSLLDLEEGTPLGQTS